jgi:hypothetical protein
VCFVHKVVVPNQSFPYEIIQLRTTISAVCPVSTVSVALKHLEWRPRVCWSHSLRFAFLLQGEVDVACSIQVLGD